MPYELFHGVCYLAYLIPLITEVKSAEIASLYPPLHKYKREIPTSQKIASILLPWYGMYITQQELESLSKVLENHLNASSRAMLAEHRELQEVKTVALQNRMALGLLLAAQGGTCKVIGTECCFYISDATAEVIDMAHDTAQGIKELHDKHGFNFGDFSGTLGSWGSGLVKFLTTLLLTPHCPPRVLRSSAILSLTQPSSKLKGYGDRAFSRAAPRLWNSLPPSVRDSPSLSIYKTRLKTFLFSQAFNRPHPSP